MGKEELIDPLQNLDNLADEETKTLTPEEESDNSTDDQEPEAKEETTEEESKEDESNDESKEDEPKEKKPKEPTKKETRRQQQEKGRLQEVQRLRGMVIDAEVQKAEADGKNLIDLAKKDPKMADEVAKKFGYADYKEAKLHLSSGDEASKKTRDDDDKEIYYQERKAKDDHEAALLDAKTLLEGLPEEIQEEAIDEFNELVEGRTLTKKTALKYANMVTLSLKKEEKKDSTAELKKLSSTGISKTKKPANSGLVEVIVDGKVQLLDPKLLK